MLTEYLKRILHISDSMEGKILYNDQGNSVASLLQPTVASVVQNHAEMNEIEMSVHVTLCVCILLGKAYC